MKKFLLATLIGTSLMTTLVGASSAFAAVQGADGNKIQKVEVGYTSTAEIATTEYMVSIPTKLNIASDTKETDFEIKLYGPQGEAYAGGSTISVTVASENESDNIFKLKGNSGSADYVIMFDGVSTTDTQLSGDKLTRQGKAKITSNSVKPGTYKDTLTFTVTKG